MDRKNPINSYIIEFETAVQRKLMRLNIVALQDQMDAVRYCTQWLLNHLDKMDAYSPVQLASATTIGRHYPAHLLGTSASRLCHLVFRPVIRAFGE